MRKALIIGIDNYKYFYNDNLNSCVNDAVEIEKIFKNGDLKYNTKILLDENATTTNIRKEIHSLFSSKSNVALLYFSGHGFDDNNDGVIVTHDGVAGNCGIDMSYIIKEANRSNCKNRIIILDCCHAGFIGEIGAIGDITLIKDGVVLLSSCREKESSYCKNGFSDFTSFLIEALNGGASNIFGEITPESIYSYIDNIMFTKQQRPLFKASVSNFVVVKKVKPDITRKKLRKLKQFFPNQNFKYKLSPDYEPTNYKGSKHYHIEPYFNKSKGQLFTFLQKMNRLGIVKPDGCRHMYDAVMKSKSCSLTNYGKLIWNMIK